MAHDQSALPQHVPGPAQWLAWPGLEPQQPWSEGLGMDGPDLPVKLLVAATSFLAGAPQTGQVGVSVAPGAMVSPA